MELLGLQESVECELSLLFISICIELILHGAVLAGVAELETDSIPPQCIEIAQVTHPHIYMSRFDSMK